MEARWEEIEACYRRTIKWRGKRMVVTWKRYAYAFYAARPKYVMFSSVCDPLDWTTQFTVMQTKTPA